MNLCLILCLSQINNSDVSVQEKETSGGTKHEIVSDADVTRDNTTPESTDATNNIAADMTVATIAQELTDTSEMVTKTKPLEEQKHRQIYRIYKRIVETKKDKKSAKRTKEYCSDSSTDVEFTLVRSALDFSCKCPVLVDLKNKFNILGFSISVVSIEDVKNNVNKAVIQPSCCLTKGCHNKDDPTRGIEDLFEISNHPHSTFIVFPIHAQYTYCDVKSSVGEQTSTNSIDWNYGVSVNYCTNSKLGICTTKQEPKSVISPVFRQLESISPVVRQLERGDIDDQPESKPLDVITNSSTMVIPSSSLHIFKSLFLSHCDHKSGITCLRHADIPGLRKIRSFANTECSSLDNIVSKSTVAKLHTFYRKKNIKVEMRPTDEDHLKKVSHEMQLARKSKTSIYNSDQSVISRITDLLPSGEFQEIVLVVQPYLNLPTSLSLIPMVFVAALSYFKLGNRSEAASFFEQGTELCLKYNKLGDCALCELYLGDIHFVLRNFLQASSYYQKAICNYSSDTVAALFCIVPPSLSTIHSKSMVQLSKMLQK